MADHTIEQPEVSIRLRWSQSWSVVKYLWCERLTLTASPNIDSAQFTWDYAGQKMRHDTFFMSAYYPQELRGAYVRVQWNNGTGTSTWVGVIVHETDIQQATDQNGDKIGMQSFTAYGLEWLLSREQIHTSVIDRPGVGPVTVERAIDFNMGGSRGREIEVVGNKHKDNGQNLFTSDLSDADTWDNYEILDYLLTAHSPKDQNDNTTIEFTTSFLDAFSLAGVVEQVSVQRKSVKQVLDAMISQFRGIGYKTRWNDSNNKIELSVYTYTFEDIPLPGGGTLQANNDKTALDLQSDILVSPPVFNYDGGSKYLRVKVRGELATFTGTFKNGIDLEPQWTEAEDSAYSQAASSESGYSSATLMEKQQWNSEVRSSDLLRKVYSYFKLIDNWDGQLSSEDVDPEHRPFWVPGLRFLPYTLLKEWHDYSIANIADGTTDDTLPAGVTADYRPPFGVIDDVGGRYAFVDRLSEQGDFADTAHTDGRAWRAQVAVQSDFPGLILNVIGADQHVFAKDDFEAVGGSADADNASDFQPELSYDDVWFTASMQLDYHCEAEYPTTVSGTYDYVPTKVIDVPNMRLDYVVPSTVVDIDSAGNTSESNGGYIQDDRLKLQNIARLAYEWYSKDRVAVRFGYKTTKVDLEPGQMVTTITSGGQPQEVNTVVTSVDYDFRSGMTSVATGFGELDFGGFVS